MSAKPARIASDNPLLPLVTVQPWPALASAGRGPSLLQSIAEEGVPPEVAHYLTASIAMATRRAYRGDVNDFLRWGGCVPCAPAMLARYVAHRAQLHKPSTIARRVTGIGRAHTMQGVADPAKSELVRAVLRGVRREHGGPQHRARALMREDLLAMLHQIPKDLRGLRDRAVLLLGFASAMRRSELVGLDFDDLQFVAEGVLVRLRRSKTDQEAVGRKVAVCNGRTEACPVAALRDWLLATSIDAGPVFRGVTRAGKVSNGRLSSQTVALIVKARVGEIGLPPAAFSGHSLRAGLVTEAAGLGLSAESIQRQTGHKSAAMVSRYIRDTRLFAGNQAGAVL